MFGFLAVGLGEVLLFDVPVESVLDHVLGAVWKQLLDHLPLSAEVLINIDNRLIFFFSESVSRVLFVEFVFEAVLNSLGCYEFIVEYISNFLPFLAILSNVFDQKLVISWGPKFKQFQFILFSLVLQEIDGVYFSAAGVEHVAFERVVWRRFLECLKSITKM